MTIRWIISFGILAFWAVMTGLLIQLVYFPSESRLAFESPQMVTERFLGRRLESSLDIWKGREIVGALWIEPKQQPPGEMKRLGTTATVRTLGILSLRFPDQPERRISLTSDLAMANTAEVKASALELRLDEMGLALAINQAAGEETPRFRLTIGERVLIDSADPSNNDAKGDTLMRMLLGSVGAQPEDLKKRRGELEAAAAASATEARRGVFEVLGHVISGYILKTNLGPGRNITLHLSDSGEILQMTCSFLDYQFLAESLRPGGVTAPDFALPSRRRPALPPSSPQ